MNIVVTQQKLKGDWLQIRIREEVKQEFAIAADLRGASMSGLILQFIMKTIREEKAMSPQSFPQSLRKANAGNNIVAHIGPAPSPDEMSRDEVRDRFINQPELDKEKRRAATPSRAKGNVEPNSGERVAFVRHIGELTDETAKDKQKPIRKKAGK
jgi:hypothetical protein